MKYLILLALMVGCSQYSPEQQLANQAAVTKWGRSLIDCPTAGVVITSYHGNSNGKPMWDDVETFYIVGCGLKICCSTRYPGTCFPCKKSDWY